MIKVEELAGTIFVSSASFYFLFASFHFAVSLTAHIGQLTIFLVNSTLRMCPGIILPQCGQLMILYSMFVHLRQMRSKKKKIFAGEISFRAQDQIPSRPLLTISPQKV
jgi:hypothetical protein